MTLSRFLCRSSALCLVLLMAGCSTLDRSGSEPAPVETPSEPTTVAPPPTSTQPAPRPREPATSAAYRPLLQKAEQAAARGDYEQALALLERAQRIDPDNAEIYLNMAKTHQAKGDLAQARATAERGMLYCSGSSQCNALRAYTR